MCKRRDIDDLLRGISTNHVAIVRNAWRRLLDDPETAVPAVLGKLAPSDWSENPNDPAQRFFGVLLALLYELDPAAFSAETARLLATPLHPLHRKTVELLSKKQDDRTAGHIGASVPVYIADEIGDPASILTDLTRWSRTRGLDLKNITRIDVITREPSGDYLGCYDLLLSGIVLTRSPQPGRGLTALLQRIGDERTFYHEVGHHACGHTEFGQVDEQEQEANEYARLMFRRAHPILTAVVRAIAFPIRPILRVLLAKFIPARKKQI